MIRFLLRVIRFFSFPTIFLQVSNFIAVPTFCLTLLSLRFRSGRPPCFFSSFIWPPSSYHGFWCCYFSTGFPSYFIKQESSHNSFKFQRISGAHTDWSYEVIPWFDVMLLTCKRILEYQICEEIYPEHRAMRNNSKYFIIQKPMFTCFFKGATSNKAELNYKIRHNAPRGESLSFIYDSYMQYHGSY